MYLIEILIKKFKKSEKKTTPFFPATGGEEAVSYNCENHIYLPIDSTKVYLACKNCGHIIKNPEIEQREPPV